MNFFDSLMSPLGKDYCLFFYILGLFYIVLGVLSLGTIVLALVNRKSVYIVLAGIIVSLYTLFAYTLTRLLYSMCLATLR